MLERTAASLESCNLQRVLAKPARSTKRCRRLHTGFWQHGASALEISNTWPAVATRPADAESTDSNARPLQTGLIASAFLLDFLYPKATYALLRRLYPRLPRPQDSTSKAGALRRRHFTSTTAAVEQNQSGLDAPEVFGTHESLSRGRASHNSQDFASLRAVEQNSDSKISGISATSAVEPDARGLNVSTKHNALLDILSRPHEENYPDAWDLYCRLEQLEQAAVRRSLVIYLSKSHGIVEIGRAISLFRQVPVDEWSDEFLAAGVLAFMRSGDLSSAIERFKTGVEQRGLSGGLQYLLADTIGNQKWALTLGVWLDHFASFSQQNPNADYNHIRLKQLESLPNLAQLYFSLERYIAKTTGPIRAINLHANTRLGLITLRQILARMALRHSCTVKQAAGILDIWKEPDLYRTYLLRMLQRLSQDLESRPSLGQLANIYNKYRELPGSEPAIPLLRGMFNLHFPRNVAGLEQIYRDWHDTHGNLDQWGFEKYLKFYSGAGDVSAVRDLWERYVARYPEVIKSPRGFRSILNVYAQVGNVHLAEQEFHAMTEKYGVQPDIDSWNTLLKCYMRAEDYNRVISCFEEIRQSHTPDSFTYAHVMAMCAKKGDLENTIKFFSQSQKDQVPVTKEMAMSIVMSYCRSDRLEEAEKICVELAERKASSTTVWNQLLYFNGIQGKLNKCYELLQAMKKFGIAWDHQTHEFLLQALVTVDQIQPAYHLLQSACENDLFPVGPEHFAIVMAGAVRTGELALVEIMLAHMQQAGLPMTFNALVAVTEAAYKRNPSAARTRMLGGELIKSLQAMRHNRGHQQGRETSSSAHGNMMELKNQTRSMGRAVTLLVEMRDFASAEELVNLYTELLPKAKDTESFPPDVASALMLAYLKDGKYAELHKMWRQTWETALARSQRREGGGIYPAHEYDLSRPLGIVAKAFHEQKDGRGLLACVLQLTSAGFKLTRSNWNMVIRYLAETGQWERAMEWCETMLMPRWTGWTPTKKTLQDKRDMKNTRVLQASREAVFSLQKEWLKLRKLGAWSAGYSQKLRGIEINYPMLHYAFITTDYDNLPGTWVLPKKTSLTKSINQMLKPISYTELKIMKKALERQLRIEKRKDPRRALKNPFHVVTGAMNKVVATKALEEEELVDLDVAIKGKLWRAGEAGEWDAMDTTDATDATTK